MLNSGISKRAIADNIGVYHSTIYREIDRGNVNGQYDPDYAEEQYQAKLDEKGQAAILDEKPEFRNSLYGLKTLDHIPIYGIIKANVGKMYFNTYIYLKEGEEKCYYHIRNVWKNMERIIK